MYAVTISVSLYVYMTDDVVSESSTTSGSCNLSAPSSFKQEVDRVTPPFRAENTVQLWVSVSVPIYCKRRFYAEDRAML